MNETSFKLIAQNDKEELVKMNESARSRNIPIIQDDGVKLLINILLTSSPKRILEIGTAIGYSSIIMALYSKNSYIFTIEKDEERYNEALNNIRKFNLEERIKIYLGDAKEVLKDFQKSEEFDFVFMDGPKSHYLEYLQLIENNLTQDATIVSDDVLFRGLIFDKTKQIPKKHKTIVKKLREYCEYMTDNAKYDSKIYNVGHGVMVSKSNSYKNNQ